MNDLDEAIRQLRFSENAAKRESFKNFFANEERLNGFRSGIEFAIEILEDLKDGYHMRSQKPNQEDKEDS